MQIARKILLEHNDLTEQQLQQLLTEMLDSKIDYADFYFQYAQNESWSLEDGIVKTGGFTIGCGVGVRAIVGDKTGFAYADEINFKSLQKAAKAACVIAKSGTDSGIKVPEIEVLPHNNLYEALNPLDQISYKEKIALLHLIDKETRKLDNRVHQVMATLAGAYTVIFVMASDGLIAADVRPLVRLNVEVIVQGANGNYERGSFGGGGRVGYQFYWENDRALQYGREALRIALLNLAAKPAPAGIMPVVLGHGWPAVLIHEAVGHGLEGDFVRKGTSLFANRMGEKVASSLCTIIDQGNLDYGRRGSLNIDDEGVPTQQTVLIENGILRGYIMDKLNARLMKTKSTGNGRRESYSCVPMPRMTNTYMHAGQYAPEEIIASVDKGLYAINLSGGQVDITSGEFVFSTSEAYLIENGKVTYPIKGATLIGNGPEVLTKITMLGNDLEIDGGVGTCGKEGQSVPVGVGQPTLKVSEIIVGGTV